MTAFHDPNGAALGFCIFVLLLLALVAAAVVQRFAERRTDRGEWRHAATVHRAKQSMAEDLH